MSRATEKALAEYAKWYQWNHTDGGLKDPVNGVEFLMHAVDSLGAIVAQLAQDVQALEMRPGNPEVARILKPNSLTFDSPLRSR